jgi:hypothetical protein
MGCIETGLKKSGKSAVDRTGLEKMKGRHYHIKKNGGMDRNPAPFLKSNIL